LELGKTFKILGHDDHLWMVITDPKRNPDVVVLVNFTGWQIIHDKTCVVEIGEHEFITKRSVVYYPEPLFKKLATLQKDDKYGLLQYRADLSSELLKRIQLGALASPHTPLKAKKIIMEQFPQLLE
jgi:hypothetical protein